MAMTPRTWTKEQFWAELDQLGAPEVRVRLATKFYGNLDQRGALAREWLRRLDQSAAEEAERARLASSLEQIRITRGAKNAAWIAATMATIAALISIVSTLITLLRK